MARKPSGIGALRPDPRNANAGTQRGRALLERSLQKLGAGRSILVDRNGVAIAGNKTLEAAAAAGFEVQVVPSDGKKLVVVQRTDLDLAKDKRARELAYADNRISELDLDWDPDVLRSDIQDGIELSELFRDDELAKLLGETTEEMPDEDAGNAKSVGCTEHECANCGASWSA